MGDKKKKKEKEKKKKEKKSSRESPEREVVDKKRQKEEAKATETPEERNARRLAKKLKKKAKEEEEKNLFGYTNENNPFGDSNLTNAFVWKKKYEKSLAAGEPVNLTKQQLRDKQERLRGEIEKVKDRRSAREIEKAQMEEMRALMEREGMMEQIQGWEEKEEKFHQSQAKLRSEIRIKEGREKAIDILAKNLNLFTQDETPDPNMPVDLDVELTEPHTIFDGLDAHDLQSLLEDLKLHHSFGQHLEYWNALIQLCQEALRVARGGKDVFQAISSVQQDIVKEFYGKSKAELEKLEESITTRLEGGNKGEMLEAPFWESIIKQMAVFKARALLREMHAELLKKRLRQLRQHHKRETKEAKKKKRKNKNTDSDSGSDVEPELIPKGEASSSSSSSSSKRRKEEEEDEDEDEEMSVSPRLINNPDELDIAVDPVQDILELEAKRREVLEERVREERERITAEQKSQKERESDRKELELTGLSRFASMTAEDMYEREAAKDMEEDEFVFKDEESVQPAQPYWWHDKYRPRKPRYFNRVKTGYEWNKYNQTHYDKENPPPKVVQGYKFNIFYPDLIDPTVPPKFFLDRDPTNSDYCIIKFNAGPPYEDIAFKIVRKEWEYNHKRGYKCVFERGVLHLHFNFQRYRYRR